MKRKIGLLSALAFVGSLAFAGIQINNSSNKVLGNASILKCGTGVSCTMGTSASGAQVTATLTGGAGSFTTLTSSGVYTPVGGIKQYDTTATLTQFSTWLPKVAVTEGTSTTPSATTVYLSQILIPTSVTLTGINVLNAATVGTNSWVLAIFDDTGAPLATTLLTGTTTSGASAYQQIAFTAPIAIKGPGTYWLGAYMNGTTDRFYTIPAFGAPAGLAGSVTGQTFGTVAAVTLPTTFTAAKGPIMYTY